MSYPVPYTVVRQPLGRHSTVGGHLGLQAGDLAGSELVHAAVVGVVHAGFHSV